MLGLLHTSKLGHIGALHGRAWRYAEDRLFQRFLSKLNVVDFGLTKPVLPHDRSHLLNPIKLF